MNTISEHIEAKLTETGRSPGGSVNYTLSVVLKPSAPVGFFKDEITLWTNDANSPTIPISVSAVVQSNVVVSPSVINFGTVKAGQSIQKTVLVLGSKPFKLAEVRPSLADLSTAPLADQPKGPPRRGPDLQGPEQARPVQRLGRLPVRPRRRAPVEAHGVRQHRPLTRPIARNRAAFEGRSGSIGMERFRSIGQRAPAARPGAKVVGG